MMTRLPIFFLLVTEGTKPTPLHEITDSDTLIKIRMRGNGRFLALFYQEGHLYQREMCRLAERRNQPSYVGEYRIYRTNYPKLVIVSSKTPGQKNNGPYDRVEHENNAPKGTHK